MDWEKIRLEYISSDISMRKLAEKHGTKFSTLKTHAVREGWAKQRREMSNTVRTKVEQKLTNSKVKEQVSKIQLVDDIIVELLNAARLATQQLGQRVVDGQVVDDMPIDTERLARIGNFIVKARETVGYTNTGEEEENESGVVILPPVMDREDTDNGHIRTDERDDR